MNFQDDTYSVYKSSSLHECLSSGVIHLGTHSSKGNSILFNLPYIEKNYKNSHLELTQSLI